MSVAHVLGIGLLGGVGAVARFLLSGAVSRRAGTDLPWGTLAVNIVGAFLLGVLVGASVGADTFKLGATALLGSFTTFSTWALESQRLAANQRRSLALANFLVSLALGIGAVWLGRELGAVL
jgi:CrcB protein